MIENLTELEKELLFEAFTKGLHDGTLPIIVEEEFLPDDTLPVYVNSNAMKHIKSFRGRRTCHV